MKILHQILFIFCLINFNYKSLAQNEFSKWYFGPQAGLNFATSPPVIMTNGVVVSNEGCASICDNGGNLLFYTNGVIVANSLHATMANGNGLFGNVSTTQSAIIAKQPGSTDIYYIFTIDAIGGPNGLRYSTVDMTLAAGLGSVTAKNVPLYSSTCEKQVAVRHCNGKDVWIVTHDNNSNQFRTFLLNNAGISTPPVITAIGEIAGGAAMATAGHLKISPDGKKLAMAVFGKSQPVSLGTGGVHLFDFDAASGVISNSLTLFNGQNIAANSGLYGVEFSPDGTKLYATSLPNSPNTTTILFQWNICAPTSSAIVSSQYSISINGTLGSLQRAIDGKIYIAAAGQLFLAVINNPNASGVNMNFVANGQSIAPKTSGIGLPNFINPYTKNTPNVFTNTIACQVASFSVPPLSTFSSGCSPTPYFPSSYLWDFGEATSGAANSSTLSNPVHTYSNTGTYSVSLILYSLCTNDTLKKVITVSALSPTVNVTGNFNFCKGEKHTYTVSGGSSYAWSNNVTASTTTFAPANTTAYSVSATLNGCTASKQFTITVNPCLGIDATENDERLRLFPNPATYILNAKSSIATKIFIMDMNGAMVLESKITVGLNEINITKLSPGVYTVKADKLRGGLKLIKLE